MCISSTNKCKVSLSDGRSYLGDSLPPISICKSYPQLFGFFEKILFWQVISTSINNVWPLWFATTGRTGLGFMGRHPTKNLQTKWVVCPKSLKQVHFEGNLCYLASHKTILLQLE